MKILLAKKPIFKRLSIGVAAVVVLVGIAATVLAINKDLAQAVTAAGFKSGRIIDDSVFTNRNSMSVAQIQGFLNGKVPACDSGGTQASENNNVNVPDYNGDGVIQRWEWGKAKYNQTTFTCLRDYVDGGKSSAQLIHDTAQEFSINPQVLIVLLQKEQGLVQDTWPLNVQYRSATGYGCPDTAACDSQYYGLTNQIRWAATMFRAILNASPNWYTPYVLGDNYIQYNPNGSCGGSTVNIENRSTQALYNYTPYQPNQAALDAGWGTATCGAYGNRNFYLYFTEWFGATNTVNIPGCTEATNTSLSCVWKARDNMRDIELTTTDYAVISNYVNGRGYSYLGKSFIARNKIAPQTGNVAVYGLNLGSNGETLITANYSEYLALKADTSNSDLGRMFYADPAGSNSGYDVYRLYNSTTNRHAWTSSTSEKSDYLERGYVSEGVAFTALSPVLQVSAPPAGQNNVYRFRNMPNNRHFWTDDVYERDQMIKRGYKYDGVGWLSKKDSSGGVSIYRLYSSTMQKHLYTKDANEKNTLAKTSSWTYEGVAFTAASTGKIIYRLYSPSNAEHFYTRDAYEKSVLVKSGVFRDEGTGWYQP